MSDEEILEKISYLVFDSDLDETDIVIAIRVLVLGRRRRKSSDG